MRIEPSQDLVEEMRTGVVRAHAEQREHDDDRAGAGGLDQAAEVGVGVAIDMLDDVTGKCGVPRFVRRVGAIVVAPALVADAVRLGEHGQEEVPLLGLQDSEEHVRTHGGALEELALVARNICCAVTRPIAHERGVAYDPLCDVVT
jgi:hypothetical protein